MERICKIPKGTKWKIKVTQKSSTEKQPMLAFTCFSYSTSVFPNNQKKKTKTFRLKSIEICGNYPYVLRFSSDGLFQSLLTGNISELGIFNPGGWYEMQLEKSGCK